MLPEDINDIDFLADSYGLRKLKYQSRTCCVYFLIKGNSVVYVGKTAHLLNRIKQHEQLKDFDSVYYIDRLNESESSRLESLFIRLLSPTSNVIGNPNRGGGQEVELCDIQRHASDIVDLLREIKCKCDY